MTACSLYLAHTSLRSFASRKPPSRRQCEAFRTSRVVACRRADFSQARGRRGAVPSRRLPHRPGPAYLWLVEGHGTYAARATTGSVVVALVFKLISGRAGRMAASADAIKWASICRGAARTGPGRAACRGPRQRSWAAAQGGARGLRFAPQSVAASYPV